MENGQANGNINGIDNSQKIRRQVIQEPVKLLFQFIYLAIAFIPLIILSIYGYFFPTIKSLKGKTVIVTGGARGLGRELCNKFAQEGASVAVVDIDDVGSKETVEMLKTCSPFGMAKMYHCDIRSTEEIRRLNEDVKRDFNQVDILVNNAGSVMSAALQDIDDKYIDLMVDLNLKAHFKMVREFLPDMIKRNSGHIVAIASLSSVASVVNLSLYAATKHGVLALMEALYDEVNSIPNNQIQTTCICPYFIRTNMNYSIEWDLRLPEMPMSYVAREIISAVKKNRRLVSIPPGFFSGLLGIRLVPDNVRCLVRDILYTRITPTNSKDKMK